MECEERKKLEKGKGKRKSKKIVGEEAKCEGEN
jgi:hypothetical protein